MQKRKRFYFPVAADDAVSVMRRKMQLSTANGAPNEPVIGFTDRNLAIRQGRERCSDSNREVCLLVIEVTEHQLGNIVHGDMVHHRPVAHWRDQHKLELDHVGQDLMIHSGHLSLQIITH